MARTACGVGVLCLLVLAASALADAPPSRCSAGKLSAAGGKAAGKLRCQARAVGKGVPPAAGCLGRVERTFASAFARAEDKGDCLAAPGDATAIAALVDTLVGDVVSDLGGGGTTPSKCTARKLATAARVTGREATCHAKAAGNGEPVDPTCLDKATGALVNGFRRAESAPDCLVPGSDAGAIGATIAASMADLRLALGIDPPACACCAATRLAVGSAAPGVATCGTVQDESGATLRTLDCGALYLGGGAGIYPDPASVLAGGTSFFAVTSCDVPSGALTLGPLDDTATGSTRNCSAAGVSNSEYPGRDGCLFGPPLTVSNPISPATSSCLVSRIVGPVSGAGSCGGTIDRLDVPIVTDLYLVGDLLDGLAPDRPNVPGIQPCPLCAGAPGAERCQGGPRHGLPCVPGSVALGLSAPTSHDCPPPPLALVVDASLPVTLTVATTTRTATDLPVQPSVFCGFCGTLIGTFEGPPAHPCTSDAGCTTAPFTRCRQRNPGAFGRSEARAITTTGTSAACLADGTAEPAVLAGSFCVPPTYDVVIDPILDLPGPGVLTLPVMLLLQ